MLWDFNLPPGSPLSAYALRASAYALRASAYALTRFGGLKPAEAHVVSVGRVAGTSGRCNLNGQ